MGNENNHTVADRIGMITNLGNEKHHTVADRIGKIMNLSSEGHHRVEDRMVAGGADHMVTRKHEKFITENGCPMGVVKAMATLNREATMHAQWQLADA